MWFIFYSHLPIFVFFSFQLFECFPVSFYYSFLINFLIVKEHILHDFCSFKLANNYFVAQNIWMNLVFHRHYKKKCVLLFFKPFHKYWLAWIDATNFNYLYLNWVSVYLFYWLLKEMLKSRLWSWICLFLYSILSGALVFWNPTTCWTQI